MDHNEIRAAFGANDDRRDAGLATPPDVARCDDVPYGPHGVWNLLDVYRPRSAGSAMLPCIVSVHGGGWVYGDKDRYQYYCMDLARRGFAVVNFTYRLAPEHPFPAAVEDVNAAFLWTEENADTYGLDMGRLFAVGDSAGAQLLAQYAAMRTDPAFGAMYALTYPRTPIRAVALHCGHYCFQLPENGRPDGVMAAYFGPDAAEKLPLVDTLAHITPAFPPAMVMTAQYDFLKDQAPLMQRALVAAGVPCRYRLYGQPGQEHMGHVFHLDIRSPEAVACNDEQCEFFRAFT